MEEKEVYLYSIRSGKLTVHQGVLEKSTYRYRKLFRGRKKRTLCPSEPGIIEDKNLWLPEKDDDRAKNLFILAEEGFIQDLENRLEMHRSIIKLLQS